LFTRLQKVGICISHKSTIRFIDTLGEDFDIPVMMWCKKISDTTWKDDLETTIVNDKIVNAVPDPLVEVEKSASLTTSSPSSNSNSLSPLSDLHPDDLKHSSPSSESICISESSTSTICPDTPQPASSNIDFPTFKIVIDNVDKSVKPRHETSEHHNQSLHYVHGYAVKDRINVSGLDDSPVFP
jgi:hypothetical protein